MPTSDLFIDVARGIFVASRDSSSSVNLPPFVRGTTQNLRVMLLNPTGSVIGSPYTPLPVTAQTIQLAMKEHFSDTTYLTDQFSWTANTDPDNPFYSALLQFNTPEIGTAMGDADFLNAIMQIDRVEGGIPIPMILQAVTINNAVISDGTAVSTPGRTLLYAETARELYLQHLIMCSKDAPVIFQNINTAKQALVYVDDDGSWHADPV